MRRPVLLTLLLLVLLEPSLVAQPVPRQDLVAAAIRARGFATVYGGVDAVGTLFGLSAGEAVSTLFRDDTGLTPPERDAVLLLLLVRSRTSPPGSTEVARLLEPRIGRIDDWSLIAEVLAAPRAREAVAGDPDDPAATPGAYGQDLVACLEVAERILDELRAEAGPRPGYERAVIALSARVEASRLPEDGAAAAGDAAGLALAETLRAIARLSRDPDVVSSARAAARRILRVGDADAN